MLRFFHTGYGTLRHIHTGIFHMHCTALRRGAAPRRTVTHTPDTDTACERVFSCMVSQPTYVVMIDALYRPSITMKRESGRKWRPLVLLFVMLTVAAVASAASLPLQYDTARQRLIRATTKDASSRRWQLGDGVSTLDDQPPPHLAERGSSNDDDAQEPINDVDLVARGNGGQVPPAAEETWPWPWQPAVVQGATLLVKDVDNRDRLRRVTQTTSKDDDESAVDSSKPGHSRPSRPGFNPTGW